MVLHNRSALFAASSLAFLAACSWNGTAPPTASSSAYSAPASFGIREAVDTKSVLKQLKKNVVIGSTVDTQNGDQGPRGVAVVGSTYGKIKKGQLLVCNFEDKAGTAGKGSTVEVLDPSPGSKPARFAQSSKLEGCAGDGLSPASEDDYVPGFTSHIAMQISPTGKIATAMSKPLANPISVVDGACPSGPSCLYSSEYIYVADASLGGIVSVSVNYYGNTKPTEVISGFAVNKKSGWSALGPAGLAFNFKNSGTLYAVDGVDDTVVSFNNATELLETSEIVVEKGGKTFKCKFKKTTCGTLIFAGSPVNAPVAMTRLPNGNLIIANGAGNAPDTLVELTTTGKVLDTKVVDKSTTAGIFGLNAIGTNDNNTALYYTDRNDNSLHELEQ
jgi:hypothetical protein